MELNKTLCASNAPDRCCLSLSRSQVLFEMRPVTTVHSIKARVVSARRRPPGQLGRACIRRPCMHSSSTRAHGRMTLTRRCVVLFIRRAPRRRVVGSSGAHRPVSHLPLHACRYHCGILAYRNAHTAYRNAEHKQLQYPN